jgi:hypothetical protein
VNVAEGNFFVFVTAIYPSAEWFPIFVATFPAGRVDPMSHLAYTETFA